MKIYNLINQSGQSLIEILIITVVVATVLTSLAAGISFTAKNEAENKNTNQATNLVQATIEMYQRERFALGFESFRSGLSSGVYCLPTLPASTSELLSLSEGECGVEQVVTGTHFIRETTVTVGVDQVQVDVAVTWLDGNKPKEVTAGQIFQDIE